ncbi:D-ribose pyranase [Arthrobacter cryoconiti]|uniref:D-ribose pyranase n=1 Tax=Arthrobacter cryoconiti TaxID=748907 RepID=A0ABV8QZA3_9MICC|nr:D-ribose pyranase [Arthrobacter cryoconiti]MCC9069261.1 D-ribose pyranase [Arthrobacter cryoconiti]
MKKRGILHAELNAELSKLGHTDMVLLADCGMPVPTGVKVVDLAVIHGVPSFAQVLDALQNEYIFERCVAAAECQSGPVQTWLQERFPGIDYVSHAGLKTMSADAKLFIRTGEATPFANVALYCGVPF